MSGRGRGRGGVSSSLTHEQLQALGISRGENNAQNLAPPPLFPKIEAKPLPLPCDAATEYMLIVKDQFIEYLHESPAYVTAKTKTDDVERYSDKYKILALDAKQGKTLDCVWVNLPTELRPQARRVRATATRKRKLDDPIEIEKRLETLERKESSKDIDETQTNEETETKKEKSDDEDMEDEQEQEDELDDGTDYANNYFDNGEDYDEEDDNLDDGPVY